MPSGPVIWVIGSSIAAAAVAWIRYGIREEAVPGRIGPATLFALALFLVLAGFALPPLRPPRSPVAPRVAILDISASMELPLAPGGPTRIDSGLAVVRRLEPDRYILFAGSVEELSDLSGVESRIEGADRSGSRLAAALQAARAAGADSVVVVTDGELEDREESRREAQRLGLQLRELRIGSDLTRTSIRSIAAPKRVSAGDTITLSVELSTPAGLDTMQTADSITVTVEEATGESTEHRVARPSRGRSRIAEVRIRPSEVRQATTWRRFEVSLDSGADPLQAGQTRAVWIEVARDRAGAVLVSFDPDWEPRHILPVLDRAISGGAKAYLRIGPDRWVRAGTSPEPVAGSRVRAMASGADLLVVQGATARLPAWMLDLTARHSRVLFLARGAGTVPGSDISVGQPEPGDWFATLPPPSSPVANSLAGLDAVDLPPVSGLRSVQGSGIWSILQLRRDRQAETRPLAVGFVSAGGRRVLVLAEGTWRWSARTGSARAVYRGLYGGITGWLLGGLRRVPVSLSEREVRGQGSIGWSVAPGVEDLVITVRDSTGSTVWGDSIARPADHVDGPGLPPGDLDFEARGKLDDEEFVVGRPFAVAGPVAELGGRGVGPSLTTGELTAGSRGRQRDGRTAPPVWPYALAAGLLCAEWVLRRRLGLR